MCDQRQNELIAYLDGALDADGRRTIEAHLVFCSTCNQRLGVLEGESTLMKSSLRTMVLPQPRMGTEELIAALRKPVSSRAESINRRWREKASMERIPSPFEVGAAGLRKLEAMLSGLGDYKMVVAVAASICVLMLVTSMVCRIFESKKSYDEQAHFALDKQAREMTALRQEQEQAGESIAFLKQQLERERVRADQRVSDVLQANKAINSERDKITESLKTQRAASKQLAVQLRRTTEEKMLDANGEPLNVVRLTTDREVEVGWDMPQQFLTPAMVRKGGSLSPVGWVVKLNQTISHFVAPPDAEDRHLNDSSRTLQQWNRLMAMKALENCGTVAAPALTDGKIIVGDGFCGTHLVALGEENGQQVWSMNANDNGVGSPALSDDGSLVAFTSESCTLYGADTRSGKKLWSVLLSDPMLSHPSVAKNRVFVVHKNCGRVTTTGNGPFAFTCLDLKTGHVHWSSSIDSDAITAPVVNGDVTYVATRNGMIAAFSVDDGRKFWEQDVCATCAPVVRDGNIYFSAWNNDPKFGFGESLMAFSMNGKKEVFERLAGPYPASYLLPLNLSAAVLKGLEDSPFEDDFEPAVTKELLKEGIPSKPVFPCNWNAYGPRPTVSGTDAFATIGDHIVCADVRSGRPKWTSRVVGRADDAYAVGTGQPALTPAALANGKLYIGSAWGDVLCVDAKDGKLLWRFRLPHTQGISSEIVLDKGRAFAVTKSGLLFGLDTGDETATGWAMAGGSPGRNGIISRKD